MALTNALADAWGQPSLTFDNHWAYRQIINTIWHEAMHTHGYIHGPSGYGKPGVDPAYCGVPAGRDPYLDAPNLIDQCMNVTVRDSVQHCLGTTTCGDGEMAVVDGYGSTTCECVLDPRYEALLWSSEFANGSQPSADLASIQFADIDGDGRDDLCGIQGGVVRCFGSTPLGQTPSSFGRWTALVAGWDLGPAANRNTLTFADVNGDGKADACVRQSNGIECALVTGTTNPAFAAPAVWSSAFSNSGGWGAQPYYYDTIKMADVDGDGKADVCGRGIGGLWCALSLGYKFSQASLFSDFFSNDNNWHTDRSYWSTIRLVDVNGDGRADVCGRGKYGVYCGEYRYAYRDFGTVRLRESKFNDPSFKAPKYYETIEYGDLNDDGNMDICARGIQGVYCGLYGGGSESTRRFSTGSLHVSHFSDANGWGGAEHYLTMRVVDVDGDGRADVCGRGATGIECALSQSGLLPSFQPSERWIDNFGDDKGWDASSTHYLTVQPARVNHANPDAYAFCGRGTVGIYCSRH